MFDSLLSQTADVARVFATDRGFHGLVGTLIFGIFLIANWQVPAAWRKTRGYWFVELIAGPSLIAVLAAVFDFFLGIFGIPLPDGEVSPAVSVPLILVAAYLCNHAIRLFLWEGVLARKALAVPRIVWNVLDALVYVSGLYVILAGMVLVRRQLADGRVLDLARLGTYDFFGEMSLLTGEPRSATVVAHTECQVLEIAKPSLEPLMTRRPELAEQIAQIMAERKLKSELMTAETKKVSVAERLRDYSEAFTRSIRSFFGNVPN